MQVIQTDIMASNGIIHVIAAVKYRQKSIDFYEKYLGFRKYFEHNVQGMPEIEKVVYLQLGDTVLELENWTKEKKNSGFHL